MSATRAAMIGKAAEAILEALALPATARNTAQAERMAAAALDAVEAPKTADQLVELMAVLLKLESDPVAFTTKAGRAIVAAVVSRS